jgi:S-disulfanyl-L-cysteine oxidoreductase SoxD
MRHKCRHGALAIAAAWAFTLAVVASAVPTAAQTEIPAASAGFGFGRPATADDIRAIDIDVRPDGAGLPPGSGTAALGQPIFAQKCASCHGASGEGGAAPKLVDPTPFKPGVTAATIGNYWPFATTVWDYINRAMPFDRPGSLTADEVYALTAYLLFENGIVAESDVMDPQSLPAVRMPNAAGFTSPDPRPDVP